MRGAVMKLGRLLSMGDIGPTEPVTQADGVLVILMASGEPLRQAGPDDFGTSDRLCVRLRARVDLAAVFAPHL